MREELIKFERYQKQFHFLIENNIETTGQLNDMKQNTEDKIAELTLNGRGYIVSLMRRMILRI